MALQFLRRRIDYQELVELARPRDRWPIRTPGDLLGVLPTEDGDPVGGLQIICTRERPLDVPATAPASLGRLWSMRA